MNLFRSPLANYVRVHRKRMGLSQEEMAFLLRAESSANVSCHERFVREPTLETTVAYEFLFQTSVRNLFAGKSKNAENEKKTLDRIQSLIGLYRPHVFVTEDMQEKASRRCQRIQKLSGQACELARQENLSGDLALRPFYHSREDRVEAHVFLAFMAYCLHVTLHRRLKDLAPGLTPCSVVEKFKAIQMIDVHLPTTEGREVILSRYTQPEPDQRILLQQLKLQLPAQPPPKIYRVPPQT